MIGINHYPIITLKDSYWQQKAGIQYWIPAFYVNAFIYSPFTM